MCLFYDLETGKQLTSLERQRLVRQLRVQDGWTEEMIDDRIKHEGDLDANERKKVYT